MILPDQTHISKHICSWLKLFCLCTPKFITPSFKLSPYSLCAVHAQDETIGYWILLIERFGLFLLIGKDASHF